MARGGDQAACAVGNSFTRGTLVLLADGTMKPIEDIELGDEVLATDPGTGETATKHVTRLIEGRGLKRLVELTINGHVVTATGGHPFWIDGRGWTDAEQIKPGDLVLEADGDIEPVTAIHRYEAAHATVHNLTIADIHTYYVYAGEPVLAHNCGALPYKEARKLTAGLRGERQAHHIFESRHLRALGRGDDVATAPAVVLSRAEHTAISNALRSALPYGKRYSRKEIRKGYRIAYASRPDLYRVAMGTMYRRV